MTILKDREAFGLEIAEMFDIRRKHREDHFDKYDANKQFMIILRSQTTQFGHESHDLADYTNILWTELEDIQSRFEKGWYPGLDIGPGWYHIVAQLNKLLCLIDPNYVIHQVKEKFAQLRFYMEMSNSYEGALKPVVQPIVSWAENKSGYTCETCGEYGKLDTTSSWRITRCEKCQADALIVK